MGLFDVVNLTIYSIVVNVRTTARVLTEHWDLFFALQVD